MMKIRKKGEVEDAAHAPYYELWFLSEKHSSSHLFNHVLIDIKNW